MHNSTVVYNGSELFCTAQLYEITMKVAQIAMTTMYVFWLTDKLLRARHVDSYTVIPSMQKALYHIISQQWPYVSTTSVQHNEYLLANDDYRT